MTPLNPIQEPSTKPGLLRVIVIGRNPVMTFIRILALVSICFVTFYFILLPIRVTGISMLPTYKNRSLNFVNVLAYSRHEPRRGDVVSIRFAGVHLMLMKRVVGLPGETIAFVNGRVIINDQPLNEPYEKYSSDWNLPPVKLEANEYYVVGDNRSMAAEDHTKGKVERERIIGKVLL